MNEATVESLFSAIKLERSDAGTLVSLQDGQDLLLASPYVLACFSAFLPAAEVPEPGSRIQLTLKEPDQVGRFLEALFLAFLTEHCPKKVLRSTPLGRRLSEWDLDKTPPSELRESLAPVMCRLMALVAAKGVTLIPMRRRRLGLFTFWATSSEDYDGLNISEMSVARRDTITVLEITLHRAGDWVIEERPAVTTVGFLKELRKAKRQQALRVAVYGVVGIAALLGLGVAFGSYSVDIERAWERFLEWLKQSGFGWVAVAASAVVVAGLAWVFLGDHVKRLTELLRQARSRPVAALAGLALAGLSIWIWIGFGEAGSSTYSRLLTIGVLWVGFFRILGSWQQRQERKSPAYQAFLAEEERSYGRTIRQGTALFMDGLLASGWRGSSGEAKVTAQGLLFYAAEAKPGVRRLFVPLGAIARCRRTGGFLPLNQQSANLSHLETHEKETLVIQMEGKLHRALARLLRKARGAARCACGQELRRDQGGGTSEPRCPACGMPASKLAASRHVVVLDPAEGAARPSETATHP